MKIMGILGSARQGGNTEIMLDALDQFAQDVCVQKIH